MGKFKLSGDQIQGGVLVALGSILIGVMIAVDLRLGAVVGLLLIFVFIFPYLLSHPKILFYLYCISFPFSEIPIKIIPGFDLTLILALQSALGLIMVISILGRLYKGQLKVDLSHSKIILLSMAFLLCADIISIIIHPSGAIFLLTRAGQLLTVFIVLYFVEDLKTLKIMLRLLAVGLFLASILTVLHSLGISPIGSEKVETFKPILNWQPFFSRTVGIPRVSFGHYNLMMIGLFPVVLISWIRKRTIFQSRFFAVIWMIVVAAGVYISQLRSAWLGLAFAGTLVLIYCQRTASKERSNLLIIGLRLFFLVLFVLFFAAILFYQEPLFQMVDKIYNSIFNLRSASIDERVIQSKFIWESLFDSPGNFLFGLGQMSFGDLYSSVNLDALSTFQHNYFLGAFFGSGLLGFIPHLTLLIYSIIVLIKTIKAGNVYLQDWGIGLLAGFSGMLVILFFSGEITNNSIFLVIGLAHRIWLFNKNQISFT